MITTGDTAPEPLAARKEPDRPLGVGLVAGSALLVGVDLIGAWNPWGLVWVERLFHHPFLFGVLVAIAGSFGLAMLLRLPVLRILLCFGGIAVACGWALLGWWSSTFDTPVSHVVPAPDGAGPSYELVVRDGADGLIDPAWYLSIRTTGTPWAREWEFGCMSGDAPWNSYKGARWKSRSELILRSSDAGSIRVKVDPDSGRPSAPKDDPWTCIGWD